MPKEGYKSPKGDGRPFWYRVGAEFEGGNEAWHVKLTLGAIVIVLAVVGTIAYLIMVVVEKVCIASRAVRRLIRRVLRGKPGDVV